MVSHLSVNAAVESPVCEVGVRQTLVELLRGRLPDQFNQTAYTFLVDGETEEISLTYGELDARARAIAGRLQALGACGERVLLLYPPDLEYIAAFFGCLYAGAVAVPIFAPRANRSLSRLQTIAADAEAKVVLTTAAVFSRIEPFLAQVSELQAMHWLATDNLDEETVQEWKPPYIDGDSLAFIQYTSGSTAAPKGVMVSHANILHNERMIQRAFRQTEQSVILSWLPLYHDMGLIGGVLQPLYLGARCILMSPVSFLQKPLRWLQAISRYGATTSGGPNFAYDMCVQKIDPARRAELDLSSWSVAFNGSEPVRAETLRQFADAFGPCGFRPEAFFPCYGLAEATLFVSGNPAVRPPVIRKFAADSLAAHRVEEQEADVGVQELVSCGTTFLDQEALIVNPETSTPCAPNEIGELWIAGDSVAQGYWKHAEETQQVFRARLNGRSGETFLRTGDLGFLHDGELFVTGRLKDLIIIRGRNLYPQDIEQTVVECHADLRRGGGVAFSAELEGEERLVVVQELERHASADLDALIQRVRQAITEEHEVQPAAIVLVRAGSVPKTSSGKLQRRACRELFLSGSFECLAEWREEASQSSETLVAVPAAEPENEADIKDFLKSLFATRLGIVAAEVDVDEPIGRYMLDSLQAIELMHAVEVSLGIVLPMTSFLQSPSITELARQAMQYLAAKRLAESEARANAAVTTILPNTLATHSPSYGQQALWLISRLAPESAAYNVASAVRIRSEVDPNAMRRALQKLIERHSSLRTTFNEIDGTPVAVVCEEVEISFEFADLSAADEELLNKRLMKLALRPFDLETGPLFRVHLFQRSAEEFVLLWVAHHIVVDFWSLVILVHEFGELYEAEQHGRAATLAPVSETYSDYVSWQTELLAGAEGLRLKSYWERQLGDTLPVLNLPVNHPRPAVQTYRGSSYDFELDVSLTRQLKALGRDHDATLYMTLLAAFQVLLYRYSGQDDILVGSPAAARSRAAFSNVVGYFVNPLVLRADLSGDPSFTQFLSRVRRTVLEAFAHQDYPFALLVKQLQPERDLSRSPLFQVSFVLQQAQLLKEQGLTAFALSQAGAPLRLGEVVLETMALEQRVAQFDLSLVMAEIGGGLRASLEYNTDIFDEATIAQMARQFRVLLEGLVTDPSQSISSLPLLSDEDRRQVLVEWNDSGRDYAPQCIHELFQQQAARTPDHVALVCGEDELSYRELNERANQLANYLQNRGVGAETIVGVCLERSLEMIVALLAVLKAGAAYLPLDPDYPQERLSFMLADAEVPVLLTATDLKERLAIEAAAVICLDTEWERIAEYSSANPVSDVSGNNLAYVIYTSGSTGKPKGAMNTHAAIYNRLCWMQEAYGLTPADHILQKTPFSFDVSVWEFFWPLMTGARLVVARPGGHRDSAYLVALIKQERITTLHFVPAMLQVFLAEEGVEACTSLRRVICSGEALSRELQDRFFARLPQVELHNLYGPTEAAVDVTFWACDAAANHLTVPIGRPIANTQIYLLDKYNPVPVGVPGELYIGGVQLARGYHKRAALSAERFVPDPFSSVPGARLYRTGDLARYLSDGSIEYLGRLDFQVKIRGFRIELGEIEAALGEHPIVREVVVLMREDTPHHTTNDKRIVAYVVLNSECAAPADELRRFVKEKLPSFMVPAAFVFLSELPLMPNGKIDRASLPAPEQQVMGEPADGQGPRDLVEELIAVVWAVVLGVERVGIHDNFFELGGHSLLGAQVMSRIQKAFKTELPLRLLFEFPTVAAFAEQISAIRKEDLVTPPPFEHVSRAEDLPLSFAQQRLWFLDQLEPGLAAYNMPGAVQISGPLDPAVLEKSLSEIVRRHETLRTSFAVRNGEPVQVVAAAAPLNLPVIDLRELPLTERDPQFNEILTREAREPFDLARGPLLRVKLVRLADSEHVLLLTMHHIVSDGWSLDLFLQELATLYQAYADGVESPLPPLPIQYADFAAWQRNWLQDEKLDSLLAYWVRQLNGAPPVLELPADHLRPAMRSYNGARQSLMLPPILTDDLKRLSRDQGVTLFMVLAAAFKVLLYRYSGQKDIVIGTVSANRNQADIEALIGFFVNTLVLRTDLSETRTFRALLGRIRETVIDACTHQDLPFEKLVEELQPERDISRTPLFQVLLVQQKQMTPELETAGVRFRPVELDTMTTKFDLTLNFAEADQELRLTLEYSTDLFEAATAERMLGHLQTLLEAAVANPEQHIAELPLLTNVEQQQLLSEWNDTHREYAAECVHALFEKQVSLTPNAVALVFNNERLTYLELNARANQIAHVLRKLGVGRESLVGIYLERTPEMIAGILGVLKAGGAYVPLDQAYPSERLKLILADCGISALLTQTHLRKNLPELEAPIICFDSDREILSAQSEENPASDVQPDNLAYVIYTSGSTGRPKGVAITHQSVTTMLRWAQEVFSAEQLRGVLASTSICFDLSVFEMFLPLSVGGQVILARNALELPQLPAKNEVSLINTVPSAIAELIRTRDVPETVKTINLAGEALKSELVKQIYEHTGASQVWNLYGPSEDTTYSTFALIPKENNDLIVIGRPIACSQAYLLDQQLQPVPVGVTAELYLGGAGLARGYLGRPELTAEKFIPDAFGKERGARLYRTGDLARYLPDGNIEYLGRMDYQVKIRGFRIELGEIEAALAEQPLVRDVVVLVREDTPEDKRIVAYVILNQECATPADELRRALKDKLPSFMIPSAFVVLEALPLTPNGKIDRKALPAPDHARPGLERAFVAPRTPIEEIIAGIWSQILRLEKVGIHDNFFSLGGHSLLATRAAHRVRDTFNVALPLRLFFETPTVADLADYVARCQVREADDATLSAALAELSQLSPEEMESLLAAQKVSAEIGSLS